jgi:hypothetical protein
MINDSERIILGRAINEAAFHYVSPLWWGHLDEPGGRVFDNGTVFVVETGNLTIAVTAGHVLQACIRDQNEDPERVLVKIGNLAFRPRDHVIDISTYPDLGTLKLEPGVVSRLGINPYHCRDDDWPPELPTVAQAVFFSGFPGQERGPDSDDRESFGAYSAILITTSVSEESISLQIDHSEMEDYLGGGMPPPGYEMGGISGAPLFRLIEKGVRPWELVGVVVEASPTLDVVKAAPARNIDLQGRISHL